MYYKGKKVSAGELILGSTIIVLGITGVGLLGEGIASEIIKNYNSNLKDKQIETTIETDLVDKTQLGDEKTFDAGEHYIRVRVPEKNANNNKYSVTGIDEIPEGYEVYSITPYTVKVNNGSATGGYDIWYVNNEEVKVTATYNNQTKQYGYYTFGEVVEKEKQLTK